MDIRLVYAPLLWLCVILFMFRVIGQVYVAVYEPRWLPAMREWYSGLLPYYLLLPAQLIILALMVVISYDHSRGDGYFVVNESTPGRTLMGLSAFYASSMFVRYVWIMAKHPERRWFKGTIPIFFHFLLASFIFLIGSFHLF